MNIVIYARFSSHSQNEQSIEGQLKICYDYAERNNYTVIGEYIDRALSGTTDNRPEFQKMIDDSGRKHFQGVLVYQLDRFARNRYDSAIYKAKLKKNGVRVFSARENISDDASGVLMEAVLEGMAEYYSRELSQKIKRGMDINASKCLATGGGCALGYKIDKSTRQFLIDDNTAPVVQKIFEMYASDKTVTEICEHFNSQQIKTSTGSIFNKNSLRKMLKNRRYIGYYTYKDTEVKDGMPRIISDELFYKVAEKMEKNKKAPARAKEEYLLTTKLFCGHCKEMMTGISGTSKTGKIHNYYVCNHVKKKLCDKKNIQKDFIENLVIEECRKLLTDENITKIADEVVALSEKEKDNSNARRLYKLIKDNEKQKANLIDALKIGNANESVTRVIFDELEKLDKTRSDIEKQITLEEVQHIKLTVPEIKFFLTQLKKGDINDIKYRRTLISVFVNKLYLYDDKLTFIFNTQGKAVEVDTALLADIESSFIGDTPPLKN